MTVKFTPLAKEEENNNTSVQSAEIQKAKDALEIQKLETERIELQRQAEFAKNDIKDSSDLKSRMATLAEKENKLAKDIIELESQKTLELSEAQKLKAEQDRKLSELIKREQDLATRIKNVERRESLVKERENLMNSVEQQKLKETETYNSLSEQLKRNFPQVVKLMADNANALESVGFLAFADSLWEEIETMKKWAKNDINSHTNAIIGWLKGEVEECNETAVAMSRSPKQYNESSWNSIVDNLEAIYKLLPAVRPAYLPSDDAMDSKRV